MQDVFRACLTPEHAGLLEAPANDGLASGFNHAAADEVSLAAKIAVAGALDVGGEVGDLASRVFPALFVEVRACGEQSRGLLQDALDVAVFEFGSPDGLLCGAEFPIAIKGTGKLAEVFDGMIEVEYLDGGREEEPGVFPDPGGSVAKEDDDLCEREPAPDGFAAELFPAGAAVAHGADITGGVGIAHGVSIYVGGRLGEDAAEFGFAGAGGTVGLFAFAPGEFLGTGGHAGAVVFKVEDGNGFAGGARRKGGQGFGQVGGEAVDEAVKRAGVEFQSGEDGEDACGLQIGIAGVGGCLTDEFGQCRGVVLGEIKGEIQRRASAVAVGVVKVTALERDGAKQGVDGNGAVFMNGLAGKWRGVVGDELAVVEQVLDDAPRVAGKGVAQAGLEPLGQESLLFFLGEPLTSLGEEEFGFAVFFGKALGLEVFFP